MRRLNDNEIVLTREFIDRSLDRRWDDYTNTFICRDSWEDGKRRMDPEMYDMAQQMMGI